MDTLTSMMTFLPPWIPMTIAILLTTWLMLAVASWLGPPSPRRRYGPGLTPLGWRWIEGSLNRKFRKDPSGVLGVLDNRIAELKLPPFPERNN